jgi:hypothetical protein
LNASRPRNALHFIYEIGREKLLDDAVEEGRVSRNTFADIGTGGEKVEEADGGREVVLRQGGVVEGRFVAGLVFHESIEVL